MISKVEARLIVDKKIARLLESVRDLRSERNGLAPISILPPEILAAIFYFASVGRTETSRFFPCYYFTHVCRSWRSLALATPNLWRVLPRDIRWADIVLERSKGADLVVREDFLIRGFESSRITFLKRVLANHTPRIRELGLSRVDIPTLSMLVENLPQSSLRLQSLTLSSSETVRETQPTLPLGILDTGNLQTLVVDQCIIRHWFSLGSFPALTTLTLHNILDRPPLIDFLEILRCAPSLRVLNMRDSVPLTNDLVGRVASVHLPNLRRLSLWSTGSPKGVTNILPFLLVPSTATLRFSVRLTTSGEAETIDWDESVASSFSAFFRHLQQDTESSYSCLELTGFGRHLRFDGWKDAETTPPDLVLDLHTPRLFNYTSNLLQQIIPSFPFLNTTILNLGDPSLPVDTFGRLPHLQKISVYENYTAELIRALRYKPDNNEPVMLFPALQFLWIESYRFDKRSAGVEDLRCCLAERRERKVGLSKLKLTFSNIRAKDVKHLCEIVDEVEWDEKECPYR